MLESIRGKTQEFGQVTKKYSEMRNVLEKLLVEDFKLDENSFGGYVKKDVEYQGVPLQVTVLAKFFNPGIKDDQIKLKWLSKLTINVIIENVASGINESQEVPATMCISAGPKRIRTNNTISIHEASNIVKNLEGVTSLLTPKTN